jgi:hypothetical protein
MLDRVALQTVSYRNIIIQLIIIPSNSGSSGSGVNECSLLEIAVKKLIKYRRVACLISLLLFLFVATRLSTVSHFITVFNPWSLIKES